MAQDLGWSQHSISRRLGGYVKFSVAELADIADYLNVPLGALIPDATETKTGA